MEKKKTYITRLILVTVIIVVINILLYRFSFRLDFTADKRYTLSKATKEILKKLEEPVTINAYFSENLPPNIAETRNDFKDLLTEYEKRSDRMIVYEFINPNESEEKEQEAQMAGVSPVMVNMRERDEIKQQRVYLGAVIHLGEQKDVLPFLQPGAAMEYALSASIKKLAVVDKSPVGIILGHGEPSLNAMSQANSLLSVLYDVQPITLDDTIPIPLSYKSLAWIAPADSIPDAHLNKVDDYLSRGGRLYVAINRVDGDFSTSAGSSVNTGLEKWLSNKGIIVEETFIIDANCGSVNVMQQQGFFNFQTPVQFPFLPLITNFAKHPITTGVERVMLPFASHVYYTGTDTTVRAVILATTSGKTGTQPANTFFDITKQWSESDFPTSSLGVGIAVEGRIAGSTSTKMVIYGDGDFAVNGEGQKAQQLQPDNVNLMVNAIDWLSDDTGLNELRTKAVTARPIKKELEDSTKTVIKYLNFLLPVLLVILYGIARNQVRRRKLMLWREISYV